MDTTNVPEQLWSLHTKDWSEIQEPKALPLYNAVIDDLNIQQGVTVLDVGCGAGAFCELVAACGAGITGVDATRELLDIAKERVPAATFVHGDMEALPFAEDSFDIVTGFFSFQYAANPIHALEEAKRVTKTNGKIVIAVWGRAEDCDAAAYINALDSVFPPPPNTPGPFALAEEHALQHLALEAGLTPDEVKEVKGTWKYPDAETAMKGLLSMGLAVKAIEHLNYNRVYDAVFDAIKQFKQPDGSYILQNKYCYLIAIV